MDLALHFPCTYTSFEHCLSRTTVYRDRRIQLQEKASSSSSMGRSNKGSVYCKKQSDRQSSNPSKSNQEEIISLLKRIQASISKGESQGVAEKKKKNNESSEEKPLTKAILDVLEKSRKNSRGDTTSVKEEQPKRQEELTRPRELKEVARNKGIKGYSKLKKSELLERLRSSSF